MDDICYLIEAVDTIIDTLDKLIVSGDILSDFQTVMCKLDYLQGLVVNLDLNDSLSEMVGAAYTLMSDIDRRNQAHSSGYKAPVDRNGGRGRPSYDISEEQLSFLLHQGFNSSDICQLLGVSVVACFPLEDCLLPKPNRHRCSTAAETCLAWKPAEVDGLLLCKAAEVDGLLLCKAAEVDGLLLCKAAEVDGPVLCKAAEVEDEG